MTLLILHGQIKTEARVQGTNELDQFVYDTIREIHDQHTERQRYSELLVLNEDIPLINGTDVYDLPEDFQHLKEVRFGYQGNTGSYRSLDPRGDFHPKWRVTGVPRFYERAGHNLHLFPYSDIRDSMALQIDYYRKAPLVDAEEMPVSRLVPVVKREAISRVHLYYKETQSATVFQQLSKEAIMGSQSRNETGN